MTRDKIILLEGEGKPQHDLADQITNDLLDVIEKYAGVATVAMAVGCLHCVAHSITQDNME